MSTDTTKTIAIWVSMWENDEVPASDVAYVVIRTIAESGDAGFFRLLPDRVQAAAREIGSQFLASGKAEVTTKGGTSIVDISSQLQRVIAILKTNGIEVSAP